MLTEKVRRAPKDCMNEAQWFFKNHQGSSAETIPYR